MTAEWSSMKSIDLNPSRVEAIEAIAVVGPTAVGKSSVVRHMVRAHPETYHQIGSFTTRPPRPEEDESAYDFISPQQYAQLCERGEVVQSITHETNGHNYGSLISHYDPHMVNVGDFAYASVESLRRKVGSLVIVGVIADGESMLDRIDKRWQGNPEMFARMAEAAACLEWIEHNADIVIDTTSISNHEAAVELDVMLRDRTAKEVHHEARGVAHVARTVIAGILDGQLVEAAV